MATVSSDAVASSSSEPQWGRVLIAGGTDWPNLGRKKNQAASEKTETDSPDLATPHILRALSNYKVAKVFAGHSACHSIFVTANGDAVVYGRNEKGQCGLPMAPLTSQTGGIAIAEPFHLHRTNNFLPALDKSSKGDIVHAACGRSHSLLVTRGGQVYASGTNANSQIALPRSGETQIFTRIEGAPWSKSSDPVVQVAAGLTFSLFLTANGRVYACGSMEKGQLGNGRTGEHFVSGNRMAFAEENTPILVKGLADKKIVSISCGQQHSIALDDQGFCYVWGFAGYGRLGLGNAIDQYNPVLVPQFARENVHSRAEAVYAGPTNSVVVDKSAAFYLAGKWKTSGDGGAGQGWTSFRYMQALMGCKIRKVSLGGVTLFAVADELESSLISQSPFATMNVGWGQSASNGELGAGEGKPRSATQPVRCEPLDGIGLLDIAAGQNTTFFLAKNQGERYSELPRFPESVPSSDLCLRCHRDEGASEDDVALECEKCENPWHLQCLTPPLKEVPDGEWFCESCTRQGEGADVSNGAASTTGDSDQGDGDGGDEDGEDGDEREAASSRGRGRGRGRPRGSTSNRGARGRGRGRGGGVTESRKRKAGSSDDGDDDEEEDSEGDDQAKTAAVKRGRGRPRKNV